MKIEKTILKFTQKLDASDCLFLRDFSQYLKECLNGDDFEDKPVNDNRMRVLSDFLKDIYLLPIMPDRHDSCQNRGCALLGETPFNKLEFTRSFLECYNYKAYSNNDIIEDRYVVVDCEGKSKKENTIISYAQKYRNVPFVIFDNCENILKNEHILTDFKKFIEYGRSTGISDNSTYESWYILLGNKNRLSEKVNKLKPSVCSSFRERASAFKTFIHLFDFDQEFKLTK